MGRPSKLGSRTRHTFTTAGAAVVGVTDSGKHYITVVCGTVVDHRPVNPCTWTMCLFMAVCASQQSLPEPLSGQIVGPSEL
jgi:hypothetical protein